MLILFITFRLQIYAKNELPAYFKIFFSVFVKHFWKHYWDAPSGAPACSPCKYTEYQICWPNHYGLKNIMIINRFVLQTCWCVSLMKENHHDRWARWKIITMIFWWKKIMMISIMTKSWWFFSGILDTAIFRSCNLR